MFKIQADKKEHEVYDYGWEDTTFWFGDHDKKEDQVEFELRHDRVIFRPGLTISRSRDHMFCDDF